MNNLKYKSCTILFVIFLLSANFYAQTITYKYPKKTEESMSFCSRAIESSKKDTLYVILGYNSFTNELLKKYMKESWTITPFKFIDSTSLEKAISNKDFSGTILRFFGGEPLSFLMYYFESPKGYCYPVASLTIDEGKLTDGNEIYLSIYIKSLSLEVMKLKFLRPRNHPVNWTSNEIWITQNILKKLEVDSINFFITYSKQLAKLKEIGAIIKVVSDDTLYNAIKNRSNVVLADLIVANRKNSPVLYDINFYSLSNFELLYWHKYGDSAAIKADPARLLFNCIELGVMKESYESSNYFQHNGYR